MKRVRLTERMAARGRQADAAEPATPIDLGKERPYHKIDEYHTFEPELNHWEPDMRHEWKDNPREETGHGIPKTAKVYMAAKKATKLAMMLLGEKADEKEIEKQAKAFMRMGDKALTASINRWAAVNADDEGEAAPAPAPAPTAPAEGDAPAAPAPEKAPAPAPEKAVEAADDLESLADADDDETQAPAPAPVEEAPAAPADDEEGLIDVDETPAEDGEIEFEESAPADGEADKELEACFNAADEGEEEDTPAPAPTATASKKAGLKKLAGQPTLVRVASKKGSDELTSLWDKWSNPGVC